jgi:dipeptidyl aminopeptidase/acylaminoacyl peptidase
MGLTRAVPLSALLLAPGLAFCHAVAPPPAPPPPPAPVASAGGQAAASRESASSLAPRKVLLGYPKRSDVQISPDGKSIGWLSPVDGSLNLMVAPADDLPKARPVTRQARSIRSWRWTFRADSAVFSTEGSPRGGDGSMHLYAVDVARGETRDLTPFEGAHGELVRLSPKRPQEAIVSINNRDRRFPDAYLVDVTTGARKLAAQNDGGYSRWVADDDLRVRFALRHTADGGAELLVPARAKEPAKTFLRVPFEDARAFAVVDFDKTGDTLYLAQSPGRDTSAIFAVDTKTGNATVVAQDAHADAGRVLVNPSTKAVEAVAFEYDKLGWSVVDASVEGDFFYLQTFGDGRLSITSRSLDEQHWVVGYSYTDGPTLYYRYDRDPDVPGTPGKASFLFRSNDDLEHVKLSPTKPVVIKARDGLDLVSYLTIPSESDPRDEGRPRTPLPMVLLVHDGPWDRASGETSALHQWLASRGFAVLGVNYRGSAGLGKALLNAGSLEWGGKMQDDLTFVAKWAVDQKIADGASIAIMGEGYGGYAALSGLDASPFACCVDVGGPSSLLAFALSSPSYAEPAGDELARRVGDWRTDEGKRLLDERSPASHAERVTKPVLIEQGRNDARVAEAETARFALSLKARGVPVTYVVYPDEGRGLERPANRLSFAAVTEAFLGKCLGGPRQPIGGDLADSSITVPLGAEHVPGVRSALRAEQLEAPTPAAAPVADAGTGGGVEAGVDASREISDAGARADGASKAEPDAARRHDGGEGGK